MTTPPTETYIISATNEFAGCNVTKLTLTGTATFLTDLQALKVQDNWTDDDITTVMNFSDGYKMISHITLAGNGAENKNSGTCFQRAHSVETTIDLTRVDEGGLCHVGKAKTGQALTLVQNGHNLIWQKSTEWSSTTLDDSKGTKQSLGTIGLILDPDVSQKDGLDKTLEKSAILKATWYQPRYSTSYTDITRFSAKDYIQAYCINPATRVLTKSPDGEVVLVGSVTLAAGILSLGASLLAF